VEARLSKESIEDVPLDFLMAGAADEVQYIVMIIDDDDNS
jgi:hypothetical protein